MPDRLNSNAFVRRFVAEGFAEAYPEWSVNAPAFEAAPDVIRTSKPKFVIAVGGLAIDSVDLSPLRRAADAAGCPLVFWLHDDPYEFDYAFKIEPIADVVFTNEAWCVPHYRLAHVYHLPLAASARLHLRDIAPLDRHDIDIFFCGVGYANRVDLLRREQRHLSQTQIVVRGDGWPDDIPFAKNIRLSHEQVCDYAQRSLLTINIGRTHNIANRRFEIPPTTPGPRTFEIALAGSAQVYLGESISITDYLEPDTELLLAESPSHFRDIVRTARLNGIALLDMARRAQRKVLADHTYANRATVIVETLSRIAKGASMCDTLHPVT